ncbi:MAG: TolC family protein [Deltaproteobacteria bacterium]|nr:MAG: TolC family protein [Deltaproteobacteria bacterium]TMB25794.1 MAG: TolC family protein [Deltaproteobacteria bacterium]
MIALLAALIGIAAQGQQPTPQVTPPPNVQPTTGRQTPADAPGGNGLTLEQAIQLSLRNNPDLRRADLQAQSAVQDVTIARAAILPALTFNASFSDTRNGGGIPTRIPDPRDPTGTTFVTVPSSPDVFRGYGATVGVRQLLFDGGRWWNALDAADAQQAALVASFDEQRLQTVFTVEQRFYELVRQQRQLKVLGDAAIRSRDQADFTQRLFEGGRSTQADVYAARANRDNDEINRLGQEARVELARQDLAIVVAVDPTDPLTIQEPSQMQQEPAAPPAAGQAVEKALLSRPSLKAFALTVEAQRKNASAVRGDYWPTIALNGSFGKQARDLSTLTNSIDSASTLRGSVDLTWNVFSGFATKAQATKSDIAATQAEVDLMTGRRTVASDVQRAVAQLAASRQQARIAAQSVQTAGENLRLARTRQQVGVGTQLEVRDAELKLTQSELARANALVDGHEAESALRRAVGG